MKFVFTLIDTTNPMRDIDRMGYPCDYNLIHIFPQDIRSEDIFRYVNMNFEPLKVGDGVIKDCEFYSVITSLHPSFTVCDLHHSWLSHMNKILFTLEDNKSLYRILPVTPDSLSLEDRVALMKTKREENNMKLASRIRSLEV